MKACSQTIFPLFVILILIGSGGCSQISVSPSVENVYEPKTKLFDCNAGLYLPPETAQYEHIGKETWENKQLLLSLGPTFKTATLLTMQDLFIDAWEVTSVNPMRTEPNPDVIIVATIESVYAGMSNSAWQRMWNARREVTIHVKWTIFINSNPICSIRRYGRGWIDNVFGDRDAIKKSCEAAIKSLLGDFAIQLRTERANILACLSSQKTKNVAFLGWIHPASLETMEIMLRKHTSKALADKGFQLPTDEEVDKTVQNEDIALQDLIDNPDRLLVVAQKLSSNILLIGKIEQDIDTVHLNFYKYDSKAGQQIAGVKEFVRADDVEELPRAVNRMLAALQLGEP